MFEQATILAPGLLGGSLAGALKAHHLAKRVHVWSRKPESRVKAAERPWCDAVFPTPGEAVEGSGLVVLCSPVQTIHELLDKVAEHLQEGALVTDVGSTKSLICRRCEALTPEGRHFVGSHPMAGSEKTGMDNATHQLFEGKTCFVTPLLDTDEHAVERTVKLWRALGMHVATVSPEKHDEIVAHISHLPHVLASVLCSSLAGREKSWRSYVGNGFRDTTRIAAGSPSLWKEIILQNADELVRAISHLEDELHELKAAVSNRQEFEILNILERGKTYRDKIRPSHDE